MSTPLRAFLALLLILAAAWTPQECRGATSLAHGYSLRVWQTDDGLPQNLVSSAVQTRDGYLWFGTYSGLARFDGERFQVFDPTNTPALQDRRISCLFEDQEGTLWIGQEGGAIAKHRGGFENQLVTPENPVKPFAIGSDGQGRLWVFRSDGTLGTVNGERRTPAPSTSRQSDVQCWSRSQAGDLWMATDGQASHLQNGLVQAITLPPPQSTNYVIGVAASNQGGAWILCDDRVRRWRDDRWVEDLGQKPWPPGPLSSLLELRDGTLAVGTIYSGLYLVFRDARPPLHFDRSNGLPQNWVRFLYQDREGTLWAGTGSTGLVSLNKSALSLLEPPDQWKGCGVLSVATSGDRGLWVGTEGASLYHHEAGAWRHFGAEQGLQNWYIPAVVETARGQVWAGYYWWGGPLRLEGAGFQRPPGVNEQSSPVFALLPAQAPEGMLVGNSDGLLFIGEQGAQWLARNPTPAAGGVCAILTTPQGTIWGGFLHGGLVRVDKGTPKYLGRREGLASDSVLSLAQEDNGTLWIGTADKGLCRYKQGTFAHLGVDQGLLDNAIGHLLDDGLGHFWLSTHHGLQRIAKEELNRCADGLLPRVTGKTFDRNDGLPTSEFTGGLLAAACRTKEGSLWFASSRGLIRVSPDKIESNPAPPPVVLQSLIIDGTTVLPGPSPRTVVLPPDHRRLEFQYAGLSFVAPGKVRFRYRLDGIDQAWVEADTKRSAFYSRLPAGTYRFHVTACNNDGVWNNEGVALSIVVHPFFWQSWWFVSGVLLALLGGSTLLVRRLAHRRLQRKLEQAQRDHAIERERARIAQDIHDDIGSSLSRIAMLSQPAKQTQESPDRTASRLSGIYGTARDLTRSLDEIVWAIDPKHDTLDSLIDYMGKYAHDFLAAAQVRCRLNLPVSVPAWPLTAEMRHNLFLAFKEALHNAVKHAAADEIRIALEIQGSAFTLQVQDNGRGLLPAAADSGPVAGRILTGHGLENMHKRLSRMGGDCSVRSAPGTGTCVTFTLNVPGVHRPSDS